MKKLIINADDFGFTANVNQGIINSHINGILTSTSLMASGYAFDEAVRLAKQHPQLSIGAHLTLVDVKPVLPPGQIPTLVNNEGNFVADYRQFFRNFLLRKIKLNDIRNELNAQLAKLMEAGIAISHINSHQHMHIFPGILDVVIDLAIKYKIRWLRHCYDSSAGIRGMGERGLAFLAKKGKMKIANAGLRSSDYFWGTANTGKMKKADLIHMLKNLPEGITEIMTHPGEHDDTLAARYGQSWGCGWKDEQDALIANELKAIIAEEDIHLTNYGEL